jgi:hypothetical protein
MTDSKIWAQRVTDWKTSGLTSPAFCKGKPFTAGGLRHWAYRLRREEAGSADAASVPLARVVRTSEAAPPEAPAPVAAAGAALVVEVGLARVTVPPGFDRAALAAVLDVLVARGGR